MVRKIKKCRLKLSSNGQNMIEYVIVLAGIIVVLIAITRPEGIFSRKIEESLDLAVDGTKCAALKVCYDPNGCPTVCGNDCCEAGETITNCPADCSICTSDAECNDGIFCNGVETCDPELGCQVGDPACATCGDLDHGESDVFYESATVPFGEECEEVVRTCDNGELTGSPTATYESCAPLGPAPCSLADGTTAPHLTVGTFYPSATVPCGTSCASTAVQQQCVDGDWTPTQYTARTCSEDCGNCPMPDGTVILNGDKKTYYQRPAVECWNQCFSEQQVITCVDGDLVVEGGAPGEEPTATFETCIRTVCANDNVSCTDTECDPNLFTNMGCIHIPNDALCNDGAACTGIEDASTLPEPRYNRAEDGEDWCDVSLGCRFLTHDEWCDDGIMCTSERCYPYTDCRITVVHSRCEDNIYCTLNRCDPARGTEDGCFYPPDNRRCLGMGPCARGTCVPDPATEDGCIYEPVDLRCNDGISCTVDTCVLEEDLYVCSRVADDALCTPDTLDCTIDMCDATRGCVHDSTCDDGLACTIDACTAAGCVATANCDDGIACTTDICRSTGCEHQPNNALCDDGDGCTTDTCNPIGGGCINTPINCDDGLSCTTDTCDAVLGCQNISTCNDGNLCTLDSCRPLGVGGRCVYLPIACLNVDNNLCTVEVCNPATGACDSSVPLDCSDSDPCTRTYGCDPVSGCETMRIGCSPDCHCVDAPMPYCAPNDPRIPTICEQQII